VETDPTGPAAEFNWGAAPNLQLQAILPFGAILPSNNPDFFPTGSGPSAYGLTDMELGAKYRFVSETKHPPMTGTFTMIEVPTGLYWTWGSKKKKTAGFLPSPQIPGSNIRP
jgi:hypothetical protein